MRIFTNCYGSQSVCGSVCSPRIRETDRRTDRQTAKHHKPQATNSARTQANNRRHYETMIGHDDHQTPLLKPHHVTRRNDNDNGNGNWRRQPALLLNNRRRRLTALAVRCGAGVFVSEFQTSRQRTAAGKMRT